MSPLDTLIARLAQPETGVRRTAILDLIAAADLRATGALAAHLIQERDERAALLIIRHLGRVSWAAAIPTLWSLYADPRTPVAIAHAAIVEHDRILGSTGPR